MIDALTFFDFRAVGRILAELETPVPIIDIDVVMANLSRWQEACNSRGLANRPHIKTHKLVPLARLQLALGAKGITVQKLGEAEVMADAGITDMLLTFNVLGRSKLERLAHLARRTAIKVVADNEVVIATIASAGEQAGRDIAVLVECDTGAMRNGVATPQATLALAQLIAKTPGVSFGGLMTYPAPGSRKATAAYLEEARGLCSRAGLAVDCVSSGGSPDMWSDEGLAPVTEYRAGTYAYFDRQLQSRGVCRFEDCALTVLSTIVSTPTAERAVLDAGSKALTSDILSLSGHGVVPALGMALVTGLSEEHGILDISRLSQKPRVGDQVRIIPNHVCPVTNLFDEVVIVRGDSVLGAVKVDARGKVQ